MDTNKSDQSSNDRDAAFFDFFADDDGVLRDEDGSREYNRSKNEDAVKSECEEKATNNHMVEATNKADSKLEKLGCTQNEVEVPNEEICDAEAAQTVGHHTEMRWLDADGNELVEWRSPEDHKLYYLVPKTDTRKCNYFEMHPVCKHTPINWDARNSDNEEIVEQFIPMGTLLGSIQKHRKTDRRGIVVGLDGNLATLMIVKCTCGSQHNHRKSCPMYR